MSKNAGNHIISKNENESLKFILNHIKDKAKQIYNVMITTENNSNHNRVHST